MSLFIGRQPYRLGNGRLQKNKRYAKPSAVHNIGGRDDPGVSTVINGALRAAGLMR
ncbi:hypothetical protein [Rhizobium sp. NFR07]|uniref:hypothetical protein n=1 Tax=Rhizobium sp. NFR07 TaxID=1566262 RepID=UPI0015A730FF|nr:hypothetical protein [Rhizobium sp. NFR07]